MKVLLAQSNNLGPHKLKILDIPTARKSGPSLLLQSLRGPNEEKSLGMFVHGIRVHVTKATLFTSRRNRSQTNQRSYCFRHSFVNNAKNLHRETKGE